MNKGTVLFLSLATLFMSGCKSDDRIETRYLGSATRGVRTYTADEQRNMTPAGEFVRGRQVRANMSRTITSDKIEYVPIATDDKRQLYVESSSLVENFRDAVMEREIYARTPASIIGDRETSEIAGQAGKGAALTVVGYDSLLTDGSVAAYCVRLGKVEGYVYGKYTVFDRDEAKRNYMAEKYDPIHSAVKNPFGGGEAVGCDFYPTERVEFEGNRMPESCYSLYLNISPSVLSKIDDYISFAKRTKINTFVIDIKDNECPGLQGGGDEALFADQLRPCGCEQGEDVYECGEAAARGGLLRGRTNHLLQGLLFRQGPSRCGDYREGYGTAVQAQQGVLAQRIRPPRMAVQRRTGERGGAEVRIQRNQFRLRPLSRPYDEGREHH